VAGLELGSTVGMKKRQRLKIAHVVPYFPPDRVGGVGEIANHLHRGLLRTGHDSIVVTAGSSRKDPTVRRVAASPLGFVTGCWSGINQLRDRDLVHFHHGDAIALLAFMRLRRLHASVLVSFHVDSWLMGRSLRPQTIEGRRVGRPETDWFQRNLVAGCHSLFDRLARRLADHESFFSRSAARDVLGTKRADSATVIYDGLPNIDEFTVSSLPEATELLYVGTFGLRKRTHLLPFVLREAQRSLPGARLRIVGAAREDQRQLASLFESLGLEKSVIWEGRLRSDQIPVFYRASQTLLVPSAYEGLPTVILEAMRSGLPCVATRVSGNPEVVEDGVNGFLVELDRTNGMAARAVAIAANPELRERMSRAARATVTAKFGFARLVDEHLKLYSQILETARKSSGAGGAHIAC